MTDDPQACLRELAADPAASRDDLWNLIDAAVLDINKRTAALQAEAEEFRTWLATHHPNFQAGLAP